MKYKDYLLIKGSTTLIELVTNISKLCYIINNIYYIKKGHRLVGLRLKEEFINFISLMD